MKCELVEVQCKCGKSFEVYPYRLKEAERRESALSCSPRCGALGQVKGVSVREKISKSNLGKHRGKLNGNYKDGRGSHLLYPCWYGIKSRCYDSRDPQYEDYGGRGITVCDEWLNDFWPFARHLEGLTNYGEPDYSLDRIDNDGAYEPENVRWATWSEQRRNQRPRLTQKDATILVKSLGFRDVQSMRGFIERQRSLLGESLIGMDESERTAYGKVV